MRPLGEGWRPRRSRSGQGWGLSRQSSSNVGLSERGGSAAPRRRTKEQVSAPELRMGPQLKRGVPLGTLEPAAKVQSVTSSKFSSYWEPVLSHEGAKGGLCALASGVIISSRRLRPLSSKAGWHQTQIPAHAVIFKIAQTRRFPPTEDLPALLPWQLLLVDKWSLEVSRPKRLPGSELWPRARAVLPKAGAPPLPAALPRSPPSASASCGASGLSRL